MIDIVKTYSESYVMTGETGSYRYMAPEVFRHEAYTEKVSEKKKKTLASPPYFAATPDTLMSPPQTPPIHPHALSIDTNNVCRWTFILSGA